MNEDDTVYLHSPPFLVNASRGTENKQRIYGTEGKGVLRYAFMRERR